jgi:Flp pilus assembly protein TadG
MSAMRRFIKRFGQNEKGASALEFALVAPLFMSMTFGTIQMGLAYYTASSVQFALERVARTRMVSTLNTTQMQTAFNTELAKYTTKTVSLSYSLTTVSGVNVAQLSATYTHSFVIPFVPSFSVAFPVTTKVPVP